MIQKAITFINLILVLILLTVCLSLVDGQSRTVRWSQKVDRTLSNYATRINNLQEVGMKSARLSIIAIRKEMRKP